MQACFACNVDFVTVISLAFQYAGGRGNKKEKEKKNPKSRSTTTRRLREKEVGTKCE